MLQGFLVVEKQKGRPDFIGAPWKTTVAPVGRNGKELEGETQTETDVAAELVQIRLPVLAVDRDCARTGR